MRKMNKINKIKNKKTLIPLTIFLIAILAVSTLLILESYPDTPGGVVEGFISEMDQGDIEGAAAYVVGDFEDESDMMLDRDKELIQEEMEKISLSVEIIDEDIQGTEATVTSEIKMTIVVLGMEHSETITEEFYLVKEEGQWKISTLTGMPV